MVGAPHQRWDRSPRLPRWLPAQSPNALDAAATAAPRVSSAPRLRPAHASCVRDFRATSQVQCDERTAAYYMELAGGDVGAAVGMYFDTGGVVPQDADVPAAGRPAAHGPGEAALAAAAEAAAAAASADGPPRPEGWPQTLAEGAALDCMDTMRDWLHATVMAQLPAEGETPARLHVHFGLWGW